jgi:hypothetical protein
MNILDVSSERESITIPIRPVAIVFPKMTIAWTTYRRIYVNKFSGREVSEYVFVANIGG